jgi:hypothetical protein
MLTFQFSLFNAGGPYPAAVPWPDEQGITRSLHDKLEGRMAEFDASGRAMAPLLLGLAYKHKLPMALECVTSDAMEKPVNLRMKSHSLKDVIEAIVRAVPGFQVSLAQGLVDVYCPEERSDPSNPFNTTVHAFNATNLDTHRADAELLCSIGRELNPNTGCGGSIAVGQWGDVTINLHLENRKVYEILNAIVAQNGQAVWTPIFPLPRSRGKNTINFWYIYPLDPAFQPTVVQRLESAFPRPARKETR